MYVLEYVLEYRTDFELIHGRRCNISFVNQNSFWNFIENVLVLGGCKSGCTPEVSGFTWLLKQVRAILSKMYWFGGDE